MVIFLPLEAVSQFWTAGSFPAEEARQGVAVDRRFVYVVHSQRIGKYEKRTGKQVAFWEGDKIGPIQHLDSGVVVKGKLVCAHSNYPELPMRSSIEIWDAETLKHEDNHSFGIYHGSCTWIDRYNGYWWASFAHYDKWKTQTGKGTEWTSVVKFDDQWCERGSWTLPDTVIQLMRPMSNSGGSWGPDGLLYLTGHDRPEVYVVKIPEKGSVLKLVKIMSVPFTGQGIAWDRTDKNVLYGIKKKNREVVKTKLIEEE